MQAAVLIGEAAQAPATERTPGSVEPMVTVS